MYNSLKNEWTSGPNLKETRAFHSCLYDHKTRSVFVIGGVSENELGSEILKSTEKLNIQQKQLWEQTTDLPAPLFRSAAIASNSIDFVGYIAGGDVNIAGATQGKTDKVWGLRQADMKWEEMRTRLQIPREAHTMVNVGSC